MLGFNDRLFTFVDIYLSRCGNVTKAVSSRCHRPVQLQAEDTVKPSYFLRIVFVVKYVTFIGPGTAVGGGEESRVFALHLDRCKATLFPTDQKRSWNVQRMRIQNFVS